MADPELAVPRKSMGVSGYVSCRTEPKGKVLFAKTVIITDKMEYECVLLVSI